MGSAIIRTGAFFRGELVATLRQPRVLVVLVLGPFLVLFVFGLGYEHQLPSLSTIVVGGEGALTDEVDGFIQREEPAGIDYRGTTENRDAALGSLRTGEIDLVVVLPDAALDSIGRNERAVIEVHQRSLDPVTFSQIAVAADSAVSQINDAVLEQLVGDLQADAGQVEEQLAEARQQLDVVRDVVGDAEAAQVQRAADELAVRLADLADTLEAARGFFGGIGAGGDLDVLVDRVRATADQLARLSAADGLARLDEAAETLDQLEAVLTQLGEVQPAVAVRPFAAEVVSQTPQPVTIDRFFAPGLLALMLQHLGVTLAALAIVRERRREMSEMLLIVPAGTGERMVGKTLAFLLLGAAAAAALTALIVGVFEVPFPAHWLPFVALIVLTLLASLGIGFLVAALSSTDSHAVQVSMLLLLAAIFFSGLFMPLERIGMPVEIVSWAMPATYAFAGLQELMLLGQPLPWTMLGGLAVIAIVTFAAARALLPRREATA